MRASFFNTIAYRTPVPVVIIVTMVTAGLLGALVGFAGQAFSANVSLADAFILGAAASAVTFVTHRIASCWSRR